MYKYSGNPDKTVDIHHALYEATATGHSSRFILITQNDV